MTFNYFNPGRTGWGKKISSVFNTLEMLGNAAEERVVEVSRNMDFYLQFTNRNFRAPEANRPDLPARVEDALDCFAGANKILQVQTDGSKTHFSVLIMDDHLARPILSSGDTTLKSGNVYYRAPNGNNNLNGTLRIADGKNDTELLTETRLFSFVIDDGNIYIDNFSNLALIPGDHIPYRDLSIQQVGGSGYTCTQRSECVIVRAGYTVTQIALNNKIIYNINSLQNQWCWVPLYLHRGDKITGFGGQGLTVFRINYLT